MTVSYRSCYRRNRKWQNELADQILLFIFIVLASMLGTIIGNFIFDYDAPESKITSITVIIPNNHSEPSIDISQSKKEIVAHQTIDENFNIFQPCGYSEEQLIEALSDQYRSTLIPYAETFIKAEQTYGVNALYLMCKMGLESGWGKYTSGENNIAGWTNSNGTYMDFSSVENCIMHVAKNLSTTYRTEVGTRLKDICSRYCPNEEYLTVLLSIMKDREQIIECS